jgi:uncharacterized protein (DUF362 family)
MAKDFPGKGKVAVLKTRPETVLEDYRRLMELAEFDKALPKGKETILKINISWAQWYPACSTAPWQLEAVIKTLLGAGYADLIAAHNRTVVVDAYVAERNNKHKMVTDKYGLRNVHLYEPDVEWVLYEPKEPFLALHEVFPEGVKVPKMFYGRNIIQFPTVKTHVFTTITGAMKNAFGGLLSERRHWTHGRIHETLVDLLQIQQDVHSGLFAVMDGTFAGDGPGPRAMRVHEKDIILASADQVAIDAISAKLQGFDPLSLDFIRIAHEKGMGVGDPREIEIVGDEEAAHEDWGFIQTDTLASRGQKLIYHGFLKPLEHPMLRSPLVPWSYIASWAYHDWFWYPFVGHPRVKKALNSKWGRLFDEYGSEPAYTDPVVSKEAVVLAAGAAALATILAGRWLLRRARCKG